MEASPPLADVAGNPFPAPFPAKAAMMACSGFGACCGAEGASPVSMAVSSPLAGVAGNPFPAAFPAKAAIIASSGLGGCCADDWASSLPGDVPFPWPLLANIATRPDRKSAFGGPVEPLAAAAAAVEAKLWRTAGSMFCRNPAARPGRMGGTPAGRAPG